MSRRSTRIERIIFTVYHKGAVFKMGKFLIFQVISVNLRNLWLNSYMADHNQSRTKSCVKIE